MSLGQIPATRMLHQQEGINRLASQNQKSTGKRLTHGAMLHEI
jgi:hypothetical protein